MFVFTPGAAWSYPRFPDHRLREASGSSLGERPDATITSRLGIRPLACHAACRAGRPFHGTAGCCRSRPRPSPRRRPSRVSLSPCQSAGGRRWASVRRQHSRRHARHHRDCLAERRPQDPGWHPAGVGRGPSRRPGGVGRQPRLRLGERDRHRSGERHAVPRRGHDPGSRPAHPRHPLRRAGGDRFCRQLKSLCRPLFREPGRRDRRGAAERGQVASDSRAGSPCYSSPQGQALCGAI